ncbi:MAG: hypothetical protein RL160_1566 [Bacteroidota bacterium]|jgi:hypothetical protein
MRCCIILVSCYTAACFGQSDIQSINHLPIEEGGVPSCINTIHDVQFPKCVVYQPGLKTSQIVKRLWNVRQCTHYEQLRYSPESLVLQFGPKENFRTVSIKITSSSGKVFTGSVLVHKQSKTTCNAPPEAVTDHFTCPMDTITKGFVGKNDSDEDGDYLKFSIKTLPAHAATFRLLEDGSFIYTPQKNFTGKDSFRYQISDNMEAAEATVYLNVRKYHVELHLASSIELGCPRTPMELICLAPAHQSAIVHLTITPGAPEVSIWDAATGGGRIRKTSWKYGTQPSFLWIDASGAAQVKALAEIQAEGKTQATDTKNATTHTIWPRSWAVPGGNPTGTHGIRTSSGMAYYTFDLVPEQGMFMSDLMEALEVAAREKLNAKSLEQGVFTENPEFKVAFFNHSAVNKSPEELAKDQCNHKEIQTVWRIEVTPVADPMEWTDTIILPIWNQRIPFDTKLTRPARKEWDYFSKVLHIHELGHKSRFEPFKKEYLQLLDAFAKTKFVGEALSLGSSELQTYQAKLKAGEMAIASFDSAFKALNIRLKILRDAYDASQKAYDSITQHGVAQFNDPDSRKNHGAQVSTRVDGDIPLLLPPARTKERSPTRPNKSGQEKKVPTGRERNKR